MIKLRDYQQELVDKINNSISVRNCVQAATGFGKTVVFSYLATKTKGKVLILVNREELVEQTAELLNSEDVFFLTARAKKQDDKPITIAMIETFDRRSKKGLYNINDYDLVIADEVHNLQFTKCFTDYKGRLLGFTATPITDKKETIFRCKYCNSKSNTSKKCCNHEMKEYKKSISLKRWYGELITGKPISWLIDNGYLVDIQNYICDTENLDKLKEDSSGMFTTESESEVFENNTAIQNLIENYKEHCIGLKTMVFNTNINHNNLAYEKFKELGYNVRSYDSKSKEDRKEIVDWFRNTDDAILMSVGVFTTGFDVKEVQAIILNRATKSRSLYYQMVGRGGRITDKIFKHSFKLVDLGGNVARFGSWDYDYNWKQAYDNETEKLKRFNPLEDYKTCHECSAMIKEYPCDYCGAEAKKRGKKVGDKIVIAEELEEIKPPRAIHVLNYAIANNLDINEAKVFTANCLRDIIIKKKYSKYVYQRNIEAIQDRIEEIITPIYTMLHGSKLKGNRIRKRNDFVNKVIKKINKYYGIEGQTKRSQTTTRYSSMVQKQLLPKTSQSTFSNFFSTK